MLIYSHWGLFIICIAFIGNVDNGLIGGATPTVVVSCNDTFLNSLNCSCSYANRIQTMNCNGTYLPNTTANTLPYIITLIYMVQINYTYTMFPLVPSSYLGLQKLNLSNNRISSIGDLTNLPFVVGFYMSNNLLTQLNSYLCNLTAATEIDLSYNLIEAVFVENFFCNSDTPTQFYLNDIPKLRNLQILRLQGNKIKNIYKFDLLFVGMPILNYLDLSSNMLTSINVTSLSVNSLNVMSQAIEIMSSQNSSHYFDSFLQVQSYVTYTLNLSLNSLQNVNFDFADIFTIFDSILPIDDRYLIPKMLGISLMPGNNISCSCTIYSDLHFLLYGAYNHSLLPSSYATSNLMGSTCNYINQTIFLSQLISQNNSSSISQSQVCSPVRRSALRSNNSVYIFYNRLPSLIMFLLYVF